VNGFDIYQPQYSRQQQPRSVASAGRRAGQVQQQQFISSNNVISPTKPSAKDLQNALSASKPLQYNANLPLSNNNWPSGDNINSQQQQPQQSSLPSRSVNSKLAMMGVKSAAAQPTINNHNPNNNNNSELSSSGKIKVFNTQLLQPDNSNSNNISNNITNQLSSSGKITKHESIPLSAHLHSSPTSPRISAQQQQVPVIRAKPPNTTANAATVNKARKPVQPFVKKQPKSYIQIHADIESIVKPNPNKNNDYNPSASPTSAVTISPNPSIQQQQPQSNQQFVPSQPKHQQFQQQSRPVTFEQMQSIHPFQPTQQQQQQQLLPQQFISSQQQSQSHNYQQQAFVPSQQSYNYNTSNSNNNLNNQPRVDHSHVNQYLNQLPDNSEDDNNEYDNGNNDSNNQSPSKQISPHNKGSNKSESPNKARRHVEYKPYTLSDYKSIAAQPVKLGSLGPSIDPETEAKRKEKAAAMKALAAKIREENTKKLASQANNNNDSSAEQKQRELTKREKAIEFAKNVPKPKQRKKWDKQQPQHPLQNIKQDSNNNTIGFNNINDQQPFGSNNQFNNNSRNEPATNSALDELLKRQEEQRQKVQNIRKSLGL
jgi:hypothetical protein